MNETQLMHYSRHILLNAIDINGQEKINQATVLVIGCGGLGSACTTILAGAGVGQLILCDHDTIELSNLQRQFAFELADIGQAKVKVLTHYLTQRNQQISIKALHNKISSALLQEYLPICDVIVDCTDNSATRHLINQYAVRFHVPLVSASVIQFSGQLNVFDSRQTISPCYACLFPLQTDDRRCIHNGVFSPLVHLIAAAQAAEVLKLLVGFGHSSVGKMIQFEGLNFETYRLNVSQNPNCPVCRAFHAKVDV